TYKKSSILYDVATHPANHFKAFYKLVQLFEERKLKQFNCFPLRTTFIPSYLTLDSKVV
ncbi:hypothetical protein BDF21DRAFT_326393, partial [Thamnidium elegans]